MIDEASIEWNFIYTYVKNKIGLELSHYKTDQLQRKILSFMKMKELNQTFHLISFLDYSLKHFDYFLDYIAISHSKMFMNIEKWRELEFHILPQIYNREKNISCWNPGCNNGTEAYSLAMILKDKFPGNHTILCTDIDQRILNDTQKGIFDFSDIKGVPHHYRNKFLRESEEKWSIDNSLTQSIRFEKQSLFDPITNLFDLIICRNTIINFNSEIQIYLYKKFYNVLNPGGFLFIGALEKISNTNKLPFKLASPLFYQKPILETLKAA